MEYASPNVNSTAGFNYLDRCMKHYSFYLKRKYGRTISLGVHTLSQPTHMSNENWIIISQKIMIDPYINNII